MLYKLTITIVIITAINLLAVAFAVVAQFFTQESVLGAKILRIVLPKARRLTSKVQRICKKYIEDLEGMLRKYKVLKWLQEIAKIATFPVSKDAEEALEKLKTKKCPR